MTRRTSLVAVEQIEKSIMLIRGQKVILDRVLASLYGVTTKALNQAVKRNLSRFPSDFMIQLTWDELEHARSQNVTLNKPPASRSQTVTSTRGRNAKYRPYAFTEQGVAMLSSVLRSKRAVQVNIEIMRAFVRLRQILASHEDLARKLESLERRYDGQFRAVFDALRQLMEPPPDPPRKRIGFDTEAQGRLKRSGRIMQAKMP